MTPTVAARQAGFTYIGVMVLVAVAGILAAATGEVWHTERKRETERELLFIGHQYRQAIGRYYEQSPAGTRSFPRRLEDLLRDPRTAGTRRYLRRLYADPVTGSDQWGLVRGPAGEIMGVFSLSEEAPLKRGNFSRADARLEDKQKYSEWVFLYTPGRAGVGTGAAAAAAPAPAAKPGAPRGPRLPPVGSPMGSPLGDIMKTGS